MIIPRWIRWLIGALAPAEDAGELLGDLEEVHRTRIAAGGPWRAHLATARDAAELAVHLCGSRLRRGIGQGLVTAPEIRLSVRLLARSPVVSVTVVVALAVGITIATTGFTVTRAVLEPRLPFPEGPRVVELSLRDARTAEGRALDPAFLDALDGSSVLTTPGLAASSPANLVLGEAQVERVQLLALTPGAFRYALPLPLLGRPLPVQGTDGAGARPALLGEALWERRFGADPAIEGRILEIGGAPHRILGVLPGEAGFPAVADVWTVLDPDEDPIEGARVYGVLPPDTPLESARARLAPGIDAAAVEAGLPAVEVRLRRVEDPPGAREQGVLVLGFLLAFLLVIAGNVGNLMVARAASRTEELRIRAALGAHRGRLIAQLALEAGLLVGLASVLGLAASRRLLDWFRVSDAEQLPPGIDLGLDPATVLFVVGMAGLLTLVAGVLPGARATRGVAPRLVSSGPAPRAFGWGHSVMIVALITVSTGVLGAAALVHRAWSGSFDMRRLPVSEAVTTSWVELPSHSAGDPEAQRRLLEELASEVRAAHPGALVAFSSSLPGVDAPLVSVEVEGRELPVVAPMARVSAGFYPLLGAEASGGRLPGGSRAGPGEDPVAVVDEAFVTRHLGGANAVGRRVRLAGPDPGSASWFTIVAVVPELGLSGMDPERAGGLYLPLAAGPSTRLLVRGVGDPLALGRTLPRIAYGVDPGITVSRVHTLAGVVDGVRSVFRGLGTAFTGLGAVVLVLALMGVYSILSFEVSRRRKEIGIRVALGASARDVVRPLLLRVAVYVGLGAGLGAVVAAGVIATARAMVQMRLPGAGLPVFAGLTALVLAAAAAATLTPALRALRVPPGEALQGD